YRTLRYLHSFPTRRSSDLVGCGLCVVVSEPPFAVVDDSGGFVDGFWFEDFSEEAFHRGSWLYGFLLCPWSKAVSWPSCQAWARRSEEHTSELQSRFDLVCR